VGTEEKRSFEKKIVKIMIEIYCRKKHKKEAKENGICEECKELLEYAWFRSDKCPFMEKKTFCSSCKIHCYKPEMREKIRGVMRYSGPRMLYVHPLLAIKHVIERKCEERRK